MMCNAHNIFMKIKNKQLFISLTILFWLFLFLDIKSYAAGNGKKIFLIIHSYQVDFPPQKNT